MKTRQDYMDKKVSHADYYRQFVTPYILKLVESRIGIDAILKSKDEHLNDIPLSKWDAIHVVHSGGGMYSNLACGEKIKAAGEGNSVSTGTCILKQAARMLIEASKPLPAFKVTRNDGTSYVTSMAQGVTLADAQKYFVGQKFTDEDASGKETKWTATAVELAV